MKAVVSFQSRCISFIIVFVFSCLTGISQTVSTGNLPALTLRQCVDFALKNQQLVRQAKLDEEINKRDIMISLSGWFPQLEVDANLQHYIQLPTSFLPNLNDLSGPLVPVHTGLVNNSAALFSAQQSLYTTDLAFAAKFSHDLKLLARQNTESSEISAVVDVSKSFYDVMLAKEQLGLWREEIQRLQRNYDDAHHLFEAGLTDKIDYQQALIALNNAKAQERSTEETIKAKYAALKRSMGYPPENPIRVLYDSTTYENDILADTLAPLDYKKRIEFQQMQTDLLLQKSEIGYYRWSFLPSVSAFYDYNLNYANNSFPSLYNTSYPNSLIGIKLTLPIFQGTSRLQKVSKAHLQYNRLELGKDYLESRINTEFTQALGSYKSNLYALQINKANVLLAQEVFNTVSEQYTEGIKTYLNVIVAETDLRSAKLNYLSTLFEVLSSKLDLNAAIGDIPVN